MSNDMLGRAVKALVALPSESLGTAVDLLEKMAQPRFLVVARGFLRGEISVQHKFLYPAGEINLQATKDVDVSQYFQPRDDLHVSTEVRNWIISAAVKTMLPEIKLRLFDLVRRAKDAGIQSELPEDYVFEAEEFCGYLPELLVRQANGEKGDLLTHRGNIFYVRGVAGKVYVVRVRWDIISPKWVVVAFLLDDLRWSEGLRVFSRATA